MAPKKNRACTLKVGQIEKNPILALTTNEKDVEKYQRVTKTFGNVVPAIVGQNGNAYRILAGQARLEACAQNGIQEIPVTIAEISDEAEQLKLALLLSTVREEGGSLSEGAFIDALITRHGITRKELMILLKKSKSWISKRQSLVLNLSDAVKGMVKDGVICARTAEEIAKLPKSVQVSFAQKVARDSLSKTNVGQLVSLYRSQENDSVLRETILDSPQVVLDTYPTNSISRHKEKRGLAERIAGNIGFIIRLAYELKGLLAQADKDSLSMLSAHLGELRKSLVDLNTILNIVGAGVSPGKLQGGAS